MVEHHQYDMYTFRASHSVTQSDDRYQGKGEPTFERGKNQIFGERSKVFSFS